MCTQADRTNMSKFVYSIMKVCIILGNTLAVPRSRHSIATQKVIFSWLHLVYTFKYVYSLLGYVEYSDYLRYKSYFHQLCTYRNVNCLFQVRTDVMFVWPCESIVHYKTISSSKNQVTVYNWGKYEIFVKIN